MATVRGCLGSDKRPIASPEARPSTIACLLELSGKKTMALRSTMENLTFGSLRDLRAAAALIRESWSENRGGEPDYDERFLRSCLEYPEKSIIAPAIYEDDKLVAMVCGFPRNVLLRGSERRLLLMTFLTVAPRKKGHGLGTSVWAHCLRKAQEAGFDGAIHYCSEGNISNFVTVNAARREGLSATQIMSVHFLQKLLKPSSTEFSHSQIPSVSDFLDAANSVRQHASLIRVWTPPEAEWQMEHRAGAFCVTERSESAVGALTGYCVTTRDSCGTRCMMIDDVLWYDFSLEKQENMLQRFTLGAAAKAEIAVVPLLEYVDLSVFKRCGFRLARRRLNAYVTLWNTKAEANELRPFYMDVL